MKRHSQRRRQRQVCIRDSYWTVAASLNWPAGDLLGPGGLDALEKDRALLAEGAAVRLALPLAGRDLRVGGLLGCGRRRLRSDETLYFRWRVATWRTYDIYMVVEAEGCGLELVRV